MSHGEDELRQQLRSAIEHLRAAPDLLSDARRGGRRRLRRRRALQTAPIATVLTGLVALSPHLRGEPLDPAGASPAGPRLAQPTATLPTTAPDRNAEDGLSEGDLHAREAFFGAGYSYDDSVRLGALWNQSPDEAKVTGGQRLLAEARLPFEPSATPSRSG